jgi:hypothetical protein
MCCHVGTLMVRDFPYFSKLFILILILEWNNMLFTLVFIIEGKTEKVLQFIILLKLIYIKSIFNEQKCILNTVNKFKQYTIFMKYIISF